MFKCETLGTVSIDSIDETSIVEQSYYYTQEERIRSHDDYRNFVLLLLFLIEESARCFVSFILLSLSVKPPFLLVKVDGR